MGTGEQFFREYFARLTGREAYPWQTALFLQVTGGRWPEVVDLPTGAGKTSVLHIWLLALAWSLQTGRNDIPRRLTWVVNRRVVVDQVTDEVERLLDKLDQIPEIKDCLAGASLRGVPLAVGTLRGQRADTGEWSRDPSTPAIVIGTVDMIGSRLLFRGYRAGPYSRAVQAGLLGVDSLIVHDEAHLSPAFSQLLSTVSANRPAANIPGKAFRTLYLSATLGDRSPCAFAHSLDDDVAGNPRFRQVFEAEKRLTLHEVERKDRQAAIWRLATTSPSLRTVAFIESPEEAARFRTRLDTSGLSAALLTGTMRGFERDNLVVDEQFKPFLDPQYSGDPVWLVSTSAGEVGINLTCERMVTDLVEADHLLQRFGRLNRFGSAAGHAHVVYSPPGPKEPTLQCTIEYLRTLDGDISCKNLWYNRPPKEALSETPALARLEPWRLEIWAQTSHPDRTVAAVAPWLTGQQTETGPETEIAWRADIQTLTDWSVSNEQIERILDVYPVASTEIIREPASRTLQKLKTLAGLPGTDAHQTRVIVVDPDRTVHVRSLADIAEEGDIDYKLLLLPEGLGNIDRGMFQPEHPGSHVRFDVADETLSRRRFRIGENSSAKIGKGGDGEAPGHTLAELASYAREHGFKAPAIVRHPDDDQLMLVYFGASMARSSQRREVTLKAHRSAVGQKAREMAAACGLQALVEVYKQAGTLHDDGKHHPLWQRAMGGSMEEPLAKVVAAVNPRLTGGYRHEFGSLLKAADSDDDLLLHLIATHHAAGRPFFEPHQFDRDALPQSHEAAHENARRFARLQAQYGFWGLAYLEAVFKCADGLVSAEEGEAVSD
jgi:CRISPR-associated endonuclease/helicase Cas3